MSSDAIEGYSKSPEQVGGCPVTFVVEFDGTSKAVFDKALAAGAKLVREYKEQPYGWASGTVEDPFGYQWNITEDVKHWGNAEVAENCKMEEVSKEI